MYGLDTSVRVNMMCVSHSVSMGAKAVGLIKGESVNKYWFDRQ